MSVQLVLTILIPSITCSPLVAQTPFTSPDYDSNMTTEKLGRPDLTPDMKAMHSPSFTSSPLKNISTFASQPSNVPGRKTTGVLTPTNNAITVAETTAESILETTTVAILRTTKVPSTETDSGLIFETAPLPSLQTVSTSSHQTSWDTQPQTSIQTRHHGLKLMPRQATTLETFIASSTSQTGQSTITGRAEESISLASKSYPIEILTAVTPSIILEPTQTTLSKQHSETKSIPTVGSATTSGILMARPKTQRLEIIIIIIVVLLVCISGIILMSMFFNKRRKRRSENLSFSFRNGGSNKSKKKKGTEDDAWFGPVAFKGEEDVEPGEEGSKEVDGKKEGEGVQMVLSTFMAKEEQKDEVNGGCIRAKEDMKKGEEVPLLITDEDVDKTATSSPPLSSSLPPALSETDEGEQNGSAAFCLTSAV